MLFAVVSMELLCSIATRKKENEDAHPFVILVKEPILRLVRGGDGTIVGLRNVTNAADFKEGVPVVEENDCQLLRVEGGKETKYLATSANGGWLVYSWGKGVVAAPIAKDGMKEVAKAAKAGGFSVCPSKAFSVVAE